MLFFRLVFVLLGALKIDAQKSYEGWSIIKAHPKTEGQVDYLRSLPEDKPGSELQVWHQGNTEKPFDICVSPEAKAQLLDQLDQQSISYVVSTENLQRLIEAERRAVPAKLRAEKRFLNSAWFSKFLTLNQIKVLISRLVKAYPTIARVEPIGWSHEKEPLLLITVGSGNIGDKPAIWLDGGMHAREWLSPATVLYTLNKLLTEYNTDNNIKRLVDSVTWYIIPVANPDGYDYSFKERLWRKNRRRNNARCYGVDLNRNFDFAFGGADSSRDPCKPTYIGPRAFSEPESRAIRDFLLNHKDVQAYITIHAYSQMWFYPFGHKVKTPTYDWQELAAVARRGANAIATVHKTRYRVGTAADLIYPSGGGSDDWTKNNTDVKYVYTIELSPDASASNGFIVPPTRILPVAEETFAGFVVVANRLIEKYDQNRMNGPETLRRPGESGNASAEKHEDVDDLEDDATDFGR